MTRWSIARGVAAVAARATFVLSLAVAMLPSTATGEFSTDSIQGIEGWCESGGLTTGDFSGDEKTDFACMTKTYGSERWEVRIDVATALTDGSGFEVSSEPWFVSNSAPPYSAFIWCIDSNEIRSADFNGDGLSDLYCPHNPGAIAHTPLLSRGSDFIDGGLGYHAACGGGIRWAADFTGEGQAEQYCIAAGGVSGGASIPAGWCSGSGKIGEGDFNGDGRMDLYCHEPGTAASPLGQVLVALSLGIPGEMSAEMQLDPNPWIDGFCAGLESDVGTGDFNGDERADLYCVRKEGGTELALSENGRFQRLSTGLPSPPVGNLIADPPMDTAFWDSGTYCDGHSWWYHGPDLTGDDGTPPADPTRGPVAGSGRSANVWGGWCYKANVFRGLPGRRTYRVRFDMSVKILSRPPGWGREGRFHIVSNNGSVVYAQTPWVGDSDWHPRTLIISNVDLSGGAGVAISNSPSSNTLTYTLVDDLFITQTDVPVVADFNGDGKDDLYFQEDSGSVLVSLATDNGPSSLESWVTGFCPAGGWLAPGDFDGDGNDDLYCYRSVNDEVSITIARSGGDALTPVVFSLGPGASNCAGLYDQDLAVEGLGSTPIPSFELDVVFPSGVIAPSSQVPAEILGDWEVLVELDGVDRLHLVARSPSYPEPSPLPDGKLVRFFWEPLIDVPEPPSLPLPVPVTIDPSSISGLPLRAAVELGYVTLGVPRNPTVHVGSTSVFAGDDAVVPVSIEGLCQLDPIFGNYTPHRHYQLEVQYDPTGLGAPTPSLDGTVVPDWTIVEAESRGDDRFYMDADALIGGFDPEKDLKDGVIAYLHFPTDRGGPLGVFGLRPTSLFVEAAPIVVNGNEGTVEVKLRECDRPEDVLLSWEDFAALVEGTAPATTNRTCTPAHFARFAFYEDELLGETNLLMTRPLTFDTRETAKELERIIRPPDADPLCVDNRILMTGWVSFGDWNPMFRLGPAGGGQFLFTSENFASALGRIETGSEFFNDPGGALERFLESKSGDKIFPRRGQTIIVPNYPEPEGEFPASSPAGLISMKRTQENVSFWVDDARLAVEYVNDPAERAKQGVTIDERGILFSDRNGRRISFGAKDDKGIYAQSCDGKLAATPRFLFKHSSMWGGAHVRGAGEIIAQRGRLCYVTNGSGHYQPDEGQFATLLARTFPTYHFMPFQLAKGFVWTIPEPMNQACEDAVQKEVGLWLDPWSLEMDAQVNRRATGSVAITNYGDAPVRVRVRWPSRASWLRASPTSRRLGPGRSGRINFVGQCGSKVEVRTTRFWLDDENGDRVSPWFGQIVLRCNPRRPGNGNNGQRGNNPGNGRNPR